MKRRSSLITISMFAVAVAVSGSFLYRFFLMISASSSYSVVLFTKPSYAFFILNSIVIILLCSSISHSRSCKNHVDEAEAEIHFSLHQPYLHHLQLEKSLAEEETFLPPPGHSCLCADNTLNKPKAEKQQREPVCSSLVSRNAIDEKQKNKDEVASFSSSTPSSSAIVAALEKEEEKKGEDDDGDESLESVWVKISRGSSSATRQHKQNEKQLRLPPLPPNGVTQKKKRKEDCVVPPPPPPLPLLSPSRSEEEFRGRVEAFISKFNEDIRLQKQQSFLRYLDMLNRAAF